MTPLSRLVTSVVALVSGALVGTPSGGASPVGTPTVGTPIVMTPTGMAPTEVTPADVALPPASAANPGAGRAWQGAGAPALVMIDGSAAPAAIPEHWLWREVFYTVDMVRRKNLEIVRQTLTLRPSEFAVLYREAAAQRTRDDACLKRIEDHRRALEEQKAASDAIARAFQDDTIECRWRDLEARDRVLAALGPESLVAFQAWVEEHRRTIKVWVPASDIEHFKRPQ